LFPVVNLLVVFFRILFKFVCIFTFSFRGSNEISS
jgi:hypothetical protein